MPEKQKTSKTLAKRISITKNKKIKFWHSNWNHYKTGKPSNWKRKIRKPSIIDKKGIYKTVLESFIR